MLFQCRQPRVEVGNSTDRDRGIFESGVFALKFGRKLVIALGQFSRIPFPRARLLSQRESGRGDDAVRAFEKLQVKLRGIGEFLG